MNGPGLLAALADVAVALGLVAVVFAAVFCGGFLGLKLGRWLRSRHNNRA